MSNAFIIVSPSNNYIFTNTLVGDVNICSQSNSQKILIGNNSNSVANLTMTSNAAYFMGQNVGINTSNPTYPLDVTGNARISGQLINNYPVHLSMYGTPTCYYNYSGYVATPSVGNYYTMTLPSYGLTSKNWTPSLTNTTGITIPFTGLYSLKLTLSVVTSSSITQFILKNQGTSINTMDDNLIAIADSSGNTTISSTAYLLSTDVIYYGFYVGAGNVGLSGRGLITMTLLQKTV